MIERLQPAEPSIPQDAVYPPSGGEYSIDDARRHEILTRLGVILHDQIADGGTFFSRSAGGDHRLALPMQDEEVAGWESVFSIDRVVEEAVTKRRLFVVNIDGEPDALPSPSDDRGSMVPQAPDSMRNTAEQRASRDTIRVNYGDEAHWIPRDLITVVESTDGLTHLIKPRIHFGGYQSTAGKLYNAFVELDTFTQATNGTQLVSKIEGTGIPGTPSSKPVYSPCRPIKTSLWMNTSIKENEPNSFKVNIDRLGELMLGCYMHDLDTLAQLEVPRTDKVDMWFWQLDRLISDQRLALPPASSRQIEEK